MDEEVNKYQLLDISRLDETQLRQMWHNEYTTQRIITYDGIEVRFYDNNFDHAFYESSRRNVGRKSLFHKDILSQSRLERILWIREVLQDPNAKVVLGYDNKSKSYTRNKRVSIVCGDYVVIIQLYGDFTKARFITAYVADKSIKKILKSPEWLPICKKKNAD